MNSQYQKFTFNSFFQKQNKFMKQLFKMTMLTFETTLLFDEDLDGANDIHDVKIVIFVILKFLSSNETQLEKINHF